jgi:hypothetical protein
MVVMEGWRVFGSREEMGVQRNLVFENPKYALRDEPYRALLSDAD